MRFFREYKQSDYCYQNVVQHAEITPVILVLSDVI